MKSKIKSNSEITEARIRANDYFNYLEKLFRSNNDEAYYRFYYDMDDTMKKRRKTALLNQLPAVSQYGHNDEWIRLNVFCRGLNCLEKEGSILFAASKWIVDTLFESSLHEEVFIPLPSNYEDFLYETKNFAFPELWDIQNNIDVILYVAYAVYNRNRKPGSLVSQSKEQEPFSLINADEAKNPNGIVTEYRSGFNRLMQLIPTERRQQAEQHFSELFQKWTARFFNCIDALEQKACSAAVQSGGSYKIDSQTEDGTDFVFALNEKGYLTKEECLEKFGQAVADAMEPLPDYDPFEICFALLSLIDRGSDLPWIYGATGGLMREVIDHLPWGMIKYYEIPPKMLKPTIITAPDKINSLYERRYANAKDGQPRSIAQIVYEETGCLIPRDFYRLDYTSALNRKYGLNAEEAILLQRIMKLLTDSRDFRDFNLEASYNYHQSAEAGRDAEKKKQAADAVRYRYKEELTKAKKQLHLAQKELDSLKVRYEAEHKELSELRESIYRIQNEVTKESESSDTVFPYEVKNKALIFGGHPTWVNELKAKLKGDIRFISKDLHFDEAIIKPSAVIWLQTNAMSHDYYDRITRAADKAGARIHYFLNSGVSLCAKELIENDKSL